MFTPQKVWSGWSLTPRTGTQKSGTGSGLKQNSSGAPNSNSDGDGVGAKGKGVAFAEAATPTTPPSGLLVENGGNIMVGSGERAMDRESLARRISELENELFEYQYNMGLLLIEKKEWNSKLDEVRQAWVEANDAIKREQAAHLIAISDVQKREENLKKALGVEKECVLNLEKALREIRSESAEIKYTADSKLAEAKALNNSIEEKSLDVEAKLHAYDAKQAEMSRKCTEIDRKLQDLEDRESALRRERLSFIADQKAEESNLSKQKEDLQEWERKLREGEERLVKGQKILNQREERSNENDRIFKQKQKVHEDARRKIDETNTILKKQEDDISSRIASLALKEKECDALRSNLEMKEKELRIFEEKLNDRERNEIQKLTDEHNSFLDAKRREFEAEIDEKRKSLDNELKNKVVDLEKKEAEINHMEEKVAKREQALEKRWEKFREKEKDYESKVKTLKEREKSIKSDEKSLENEKKEILADREELLKLRDEVEKLKVNNEEQLQKIIEEREQLKVTEEERAENSRLQSELKQEIDKYMCQKELLLKEAEDLKQQKEIFEREWEELDEKRALNEKEQKNLNNQKEEFEKLKHCEEERLKREKSAAQDYIRREQEDLKLAKESFAANMEHEKKVFAEKAQSERSQMLHDYEIKKRELETDMQNRLVEMEKQLREKEKSFEEEKERELDNINYLRDVARRDMEELKLERLKVEKEKQEADANKEHLERHQIEIRKDIEELLDLSNKLKDQREHFIQERERFISFIENLKNCHNCGDMISQFVLSDLQPLNEIENAETLSLSKLADYVKGGVPGDLADPERQISPVGSKSPLSGGMSWLRKCTSKIFKFSPGKNIESDAVQHSTEDVPFSDRLNMAEPSKRIQGTEIEAELSFTVASDSFDVQGMEFDNSIREVDAGQDQSADDHSNINSKGPEAPENSQPSVLKDGPNKPRKRGRPRANRTRSVKATVEDAKAILGEEQNESEYPNGNAENSANMNAENQVGPSLADKRTPRRKRTRAQTSEITVTENNGDDSEGRSDSVIAGQRKKRRDKASLTEQAPGESRYNLRRPKTRVTAAAAATSPDLGKDGEEVDGVRGTEDAVLYSKVVATSSVGVASENGGSMHFVQNGDGTTKKQVENTALSEEVNGTPEAEGAGDYDDYRSDTCGEDAGNDEDRDGGDEEESEHPGEVSIGKKLWTFFTT